MRIKKCIVFRNRWDAMLLYEVLCLKGKHQSLADLQLVYQLSAGGVGCHCMDLLFNAFLA